MATTIGSNTGIVPPTTTSTEGSTGTTERSQEDILRLIGSISTRFTPGAAGTTAGTLSGAQNTYGKTQFAQIDAFLAKLDEQVKTGELTYAEASSLRYQAKALGNQVMSGLRDGQIDAREQGYLDAGLKRLDETLGRLSTNVVREKKATVPDFTGAMSREDANKKLDAINARLAQGVADRSLSPNEEKFLRYQAKVIGDTLVRSAGDGRINEAEARSLNMLVDRVNQAIDREIADAEKAPPPLPK